MASSTTIPRPISRPQSRPRATFGRMPTAITRMSQGSTRPSLSFRPATLPPSPTISSDWAPSTVSTPRWAMASTSRKPAEASSWRSISTSIRWMTVAAMPRRTRP